MSTEFSILIVIDS